MATIATQYKYYLLEHLLTDTVKVMVCTASANPAANTTDFISDVSAYEVDTGSTYSAGGPTLSSKTLTANGSPVTGWIFDAADITISQDATGFTDGRYLFYYISSGSPESRIIQWYDMGSSKSIQDQDLDITHSASGILSL